MLLCLYAAAQDAFDFSNVTAKPLTQAQGLSQGSNYFVYEDKEGFLWITANDALNRYDGNWVKVYKDPRYFKNCVPLKQSYGFAEDNEHNIYTGSIFGLYRYNRKQDNFNLLNIFKNMNDSACVPFACKDNTVWCYNRNYAIAAYNAATGKTSLYSRILPGSIESLHPYAQQYIASRQPFFDKTGLLWAASVNTLAAYDIKNNKVQYYLHDALNLKNLFITSLSYDSAMNRILMGSNYGMIVFDILSHKIKIINTAGNISLAYMSRAYIFKDKYFFTCGHFEVCYTDKNFLQFSQLTFSKKNGSLEMSPGAILSVNENKKRMIICKSGFGINILDFGRNTLQKYTGSSTNPYLLLPTGVHSFAEFTNGTYLVRGGGNNFIFNPFTNKISGYPFNANIGYASPYQTDTGRRGVWSCTNNKIILTGSSGQMLMSIPYNEEQFGTLQDIALTQSGDIWLSFLSGLCRINLINNKLEKLEVKIPPNPFKINVLSGGRVTVSFIYGTMTVLKIGIANNPIPVCSVLPGKNILYLQEDSLHHIYWAGGDEGLYMLDKNFNLLQTFNTQNGLAGSYIYGVLLDNDNNVWISHEKGLSCINRDNFKIINYDEDDNIQDNDYNNRSFYKALNGTLFFGGIKGFNMFKPPVAAQMKYNASVYIDKIAVNNREIFTDTNYNTIDKLSLPAGNNSIQVHAVIKDLGIINSNQVIYRFKNLDSVWQHSDANANITFNNLAPGEYTLQVGYYNTKTQIPVPQKMIEIKIAAKFYETIWFWILVSISVTGLLFVWLNKRKINRQRRQYQQQAALEEERKRITGDLHDDVGSSLSSLMLKTVVAGKLIDTDTEKAKQFLDNIAKESADISSNISDIIWSMKPEKDRLLDMDTRIRNTISNLMDTSSIHYTIDIKQPLDKLVTNITARKNILLIIKEATNNVIKHSHAGEYILTTEVNNRLLLITISDNGCGIDTEKQNKGNGLQNLRKRCEELSGLMHIKSEKDKGATLCFSFHLTDISG